MKPHPSTRHEAGLTLFEVGVVVALMLILAAVLLPVLRNLSNAHDRARQINCMNNLRQVGLAYRIWEGDNGNMFPMGVSVTNGGSMETAQTGNVVQSFLVMSNELSTPVILRCPAVTGGTATGFSILANSNISYFVGVDVTNDMSPTLFLSGDCNFEIRGLPVRPGLLSLRTNDLVAWAAIRHIHCGNVGLADGSVQFAKSAGLQRLLVQTSIATNRLALP